MTVFQVHANRTSSGEFHNSNYAPKMTLPTPLRLTSTHISFHQNQIDCRPKKLWSCLSLFALNKASKNAIAGSCSIIPPIPFPSPSIPFLLVPWPSLILLLILLCGGDKDCTRSSEYPRQVTNLFASGSSAASNARQGIWDSAISATLRERPQQTVMNSRGFFGPLRAV